MKLLIGYSRFLILIAVIGMLLCALAVFAFGGITTVTVVVESFQHGQFNAKGARDLSVEMIELIDLYLLGTVLFLTAIGLYELFIDARIKIPAWMSVASLDALKFNLIAVVTVMLGVFFLGGVAASEGSGGILEYGLAIAAVVAALGAAVYLFGRIHFMMHEHAEKKPN